MQRRVVFVGICAFVLGIAVGAAVVTSAQEHSAHAVIVTTEPPASPVTQQIGVRIVGSHGKRVVATLFAKVDGQWREVELAPQDTLTGGQ